MSSRLNNPNFLKVFLPLNNHTDDISGNDNNGTWTSSEGYSDNVFGKNIATSGAGLTQTISVTNNSDIDIGSNDFTISFWYNKINSPSFFDFCFKRAGGGTVGYACYAAGSRVTFQTFDTESSGYTISTSTGVLEDVGIGYITITRQSNYISIYVNGVLSTSELITNNGNYTNTDDLIVLVESTDYLQMWDYRQYNICLTGDEVLELYNRGSFNQTPVKQPIDTLPDITDSTLVGAWLNKETTGNTKDYSNEGNDGTNSGTDFEETGNKFGVADTRIDVTSADSLNLDTSDFTASAWVKVDTVTNRMVVIQKIFDSTSGTGGNGWSVGLADSGRVVVHLSDVAGDNPTEYISSVLHVNYDDGAWHQISVSFIRDDSLYYYFDGQLVYTADITGRDGSLSNAYPLVLGANYDKGVYNQELGGLIKDARLYNEAKSAEWTAAEYAKCVPDDTLLLNTLITDAKDLSKNGNDLIASTPPKATVGNGAEFNGLSNLKFSSTDLVKSYSFWMRIDKTSSSPYYIIDMRNEGADYRMYWATYATPATMTKMFIDGVEITPARLEVYEDDIWHHVYLEQSELRAINNGRLGSRFNDVEFPIGNIKDLKIYNTSKTVTEMKTEYLKTRKYY